MVFLRRHFRLLLLAIAAILAITVAPAARTLQEWLGLSLSPVQNGDHSDGLVVLKLLLLVATANSAPLLLKWASGKQFAPLDGGVLFSDRRPLFGRSKTWAGLLCSIIATAVVAWALGLSLDAGVHAGAAAMVGDLASSFIKRRLAMPPSAPAPVLDQLPEAIFPLLVLRRFVAFSWMDFGVVLILFCFGEMAVAAGLARVGVREPPV
ncbi:MAG TPA: CDP-archaeol synthase [Bryobacteraceae bacterium]|nr:CDP-archaeol synthase [Bryobacteraceae bacterium]